MTGEASGNGSVLAVGLMSGTSLDGIDAAVLRTDGEGTAAPGRSLTVPYREETRARLRGVLGGGAPAEEIAAVEREITLAHADAVRRLLDAAGLAAASVRVLGFHGHTILHRPAERRTWQIGDGALLAAETGIDVVADFRSRDVAAGGEGAPLVPLYHLARARSLDRPLAVLNLGGVANVTWIGADDAPPLAFDTGPGNALLDDWAERHTGRAMDADGALARAGTVADGVLDRLLAHPYFDRAPPKSLDRLDFDLGPVEALSPEDGAATLTAFTAAAVARAAAFLPAPVRRWLVTGGGRRNPALMSALAARLDAPVAPVEAVGWNGDSLEAEAFAYLAVRSIRGLPLTLPTTTGVARPTAGGRLFRAKGGRVP